MVWRPYRMSGNGREVHDNDREWSGGSSGLPGVLEKPSRMVRKPPECPGLVVSLSRMSGSGREAHPEVREW